MRSIATLVTTATASACISLAVGFLASERAGLATLTILGGALAVAGLMWGASNLRREYRNLSRDLHKLRDITFSDLDHAEQERQREAVRPPSSTGLDVLYFRETVRLYVLQQTADNLGVPAGLAILGLAATTTAGVWSLWT
ncbi:hypothetical protein AB0G87_32530 [Streptomyces asoensis]|uniref:hypothetical protein n=1 Tax=Streptomyces asoensis TaxID=249586 RepID=UPI0034092DE4